jgi:hypothetical protein
MYCENCGNQIDDSARFCPACGTQVGTGAPAQGQQTAAAPSVDERSGTAAQMASGKTNTGLVIGATACVALALGVLLGTSGMLGGGGAAGSAEVQEQPAQKQPADASSTEEQATEEQEDDGLDAAREGTGHSNSPTANVPENPNATRLTPSQAGPDDYILPDTQNYLYTSSDVEQLSNEQLYYGRNEILARYGRGFYDAQLTDYFNQKSWYTMKFSADEWDQRYDEMTDPCTSIEKANWDLFLKVERERRSPYLNEVF